MFPDTATAAKMEGLYQKIKKKEIPIGGYNLVIQNCPCLVWGNLFFDKLHARTGKRPCFPLIAVKRL